VWATSVIFKKLPKINNHPMGKISPNLVTLDDWKSVGLKLLKDE
jgi:hypothetical protein